MTTLELRTLALEWLAEPDPTTKAQGVTELAHHWQSNQLTLDAALSISPNATIPGQPAKPELVSPLQVKRRAMNTVEGRATLIHALAHIEFNAINLALDIMWRFADMPAAFYTDWLKVASEEALHFSLLSAHLNTLGYAYGDFPAHNSLWEMAAKTEGDLLARIALVPRTMEARGLDATPAIRAKLAQAGDQPGAAILDIILRDEIGHVAVGNHWFTYMCNQRKLDTIDTYAKLAQQYAAPALRGPFNIEARRAAGFTELEIATLPK